MIYLKSGQERDGDLIYTDGGSWVDSTYMAHGWQMHSDKPRHSILMRIVSGVVPWDALAGWLNLIEEV